MNALPVVEGKRGNCPLCGRTNLVIVKHRSTVHILTDHTQRDGQRCSNSYGLPEAIYDAQPGKSSYAQVKEHAAQQPVELRKAARRPITSNVPVYAPNSTGPCTCGGQCLQCREVNHGSR